MLSFCNFVILPFAFTDEYSVASAMSKVHLSLAISKGSFSFNFQAFLLSSLFILLIMEFKYLVSEINFVDLS